MGLISSQISNLKSEILSLRPVVARRGLLLALPLLLALAVPARADTVRLRSGEVVTGEILTSDSARLILRTEGGELHLDRNRIASAERVSAAAGLVEKGFLDLVAGRVDDGLALWESALAAGDPDVAETLGRFLLERNATFRAALESLSSAASRLDASESLAALAASSALSPEARYVCVTSVAELGAPDKAAAVLVGPTGKDLPRTPAARAWMIQFWRGRVRQTLAARDYAKSLQAIEQLGALDERAGRSQQGLWILSRIGEAQDHGDVLDALRLALDDLRPLLPEVADNRLALLLNELPDWATDPDAPVERFDQARSFVETRLARTMPVAAAHALEDLIVARGHYLLLSGRTTDTLALVHSAPQVESRERVRSLAVQAEYRRRLTTLPKDDPMALYRLGEWCAQQGRAEQAIALYRQCLDTQARPLAEAQIDFLRSQIESRALADSVALYKKGRLFDALEALDPILKRDKGEPPSPLQKDAVHMADLIRADLRVESSKRPYQAEVVYQQAERAFFAGDYPDAIQSLAKVVREYGDTPAAERADKLLPQVMRALQLERMESRDRPVPDIPTDIRNRIAADDTSRLDREIQSLLDALEPPRPSPRSGF